MYWQTIPHTMFDFEEFYASIAESLPDHSRIAEIGVADGASAIFLGETLLAKGKTFELHMIDSLDYGRMDQLMTIMNNVYASGLYPYTKVIPIDSLNASLKYPDNFFDFVFIDSNHTYELTKAEVRLWYHKVKEEGGLAGHDYNLITDAEGTHGVKDAISEVINTPVTIVDTSSGYGVWLLYKQTLMQQLK